MRAEEKSGGFMIYNMPDGRSFAGMEKTIRLYPDDSPFAGETFAASVVISKADLDAAGNAARLRFVLVLFVLMILGVFASVFLSKRYMKPIMDKLAETGENGAAPEKTNITEIDLLLERFKAKNSTIPEDLFDDFIARLKTLTPTELMVFQAHADGKSTDEIVKSMYIALGTLKKHYTNIYKKLGVYSQEEMRLYISMLKKCGMMDRVFAENLKEES
ncbi:MAG TPA: hypothetical protein DEQ02_09295 [Ruminococcaceae bacterium]|nr:hypothetical protein [Oscillospiraceae bacterium]